MIVRILTNITGSRNTIPWPGPGETLDVPDHEGADLISQGYAEADDGTEPEADEEPAVDADNTGSTVRAASTKPTARKATRKS